VQKGRDRKILKRKGKAGEGFSRGRFDIPQWGWYVVGLRVQEYTRGAPEKARKAIERESYLQIRFITKEEHSKRGKKLKSEVKESEPEKIPTSCSNCKTTSKQKKKLNSA